MTNTFWIAANIIFDMRSGQTSQVLMLVNRPDDAAVFQTKEEAEKYLLFVQLRAQHIAWTLEQPTPQRPLGYLIRGVQTV